jgi:hypothetical protein
MILVCRLDDPAGGQYLPPMIFIDIRDISLVAVCLAPASTRYEPGSVIRFPDLYRQALAGS